MKLGCKLRKSYNVAKGNISNNTEVPWLLSRRFQLSMMGFLGTALLYIQRACMSVAIVCMTSDPTDNMTSLTTSSSNVTSQNTSGSMTSEPLSKEQRFAWSRELRGWVLSSYYVGYILTQIPAGWLAKRYGAKWTLEVGMGLLSVLTILTPVSAGLHVYLLMVVQALKGAASGAFYPVFYHMLGVWAPPTERSIMVAMFSSGAPVGTVLSFVLSGFLCDHGFAGGWPSIFYTFGVASGVWCFVWAFTVYETPEVHPRMSSAERKLYPSCTETPAQKQNRQTAVPWRRILTTWPLYAIFFTDMCYSFGWFVAMNSLPQYLKDVLRYDIKQNGLFNSLPYLSNWLVSIVGSIIADSLLKRNFLSRTNIRKLFETFGLLPSAACALSVAFLTSSVPRLGVVALLSLWVGLLGFTRSAADVNQMELAPAYAGIIMGIDQTLTSIPGIVAPPIVGSITSTGASGEWRSVFLVTAGVFTIGWLVYVLFTTAEETAWSRAEHSLQRLETPLRQVATLACLPVMPLSEGLPGADKDPSDVPTIFVVSQSSQQPVAPPSVLDVCSV